MSPDEIVDQVRAARAHLLQEAVGDLDALFDRLAKLESEEEREVVQRPPRRPRGENEVA
jgi:hypothetical protein